MDLEQKGERDLELESSLVIPVEARATGLLIVNVVRALKTATEVQEIEL